MEPGDLGWDSSEEEGEPDARLADLSTLTGLDPWEIGRRARRALDVIATVDREEARSELRLLRVTARVSLLRVPTTGAEALADLAAAPRPWGPPSLPRVRRGRVPRLTQRGLPGMLPPQSHPRQGCRVALASIGSTTPATWG